MPGPLGRRPGVESFGAETLAPAAFGGQTLACPAPRRALLTSRSWLLNLGVVKAIPQLLVIGLLAVTGCDSDGFQGELVPCRCDVEQCTSASCGYDLRLEAACAGQIDHAEVLIDGHLEVGKLEPGKDLFPCTRTEPGVSSQIIVRGGDWVWGPLNERCLEPGETKLLVLQCVEAVTP